MTWRIKLWWRAKGFGIHSPFAYRFIREVLKEKLPYYDYAELHDKRQQLLYRMAAWLNPYNIVSIGNADMSPAIMACMPNTERVSPRYVGVDKVSLIIADKDVDVAALQPFLNNNVVMMVDSSIASALSPTMDQAGHGMIFSNQRGLSIIVMLSTLPRQDIKLSF